MTLIVCIEEVGGAYSVVFPFKGEATKKCTSRTGLLNRDQDLTSPSVFDQPCYRHQEIIVSLINQR